MGIIEIIHFEKKVNKWASPGHRPAYIKAMRADLDLFRIKSQNEHVDSSDESKFNLFQYDNLAKRPTGTRLHREFIIHTH